MIKQLTITAIIIAYVHCASAQDKKISIGAKTGLNMNQFFQPGTTIGTNIGAYGTYQILPYLNGRLELLYSQEGGKRQDYSRNLTDFGNISDNIAELNYINPYVYLHNFQVPLLAEITLPEFQDETIQPRLIIGGCYSYMLGATEYHTTQFIFKDGTFSDIPYRRENVGSNYKSSQIGLIAGLGMKYKLQKRDFSFDVRYRQGLSQLNNVKYSLSTIDGSLYSTTVSFNFSMSLYKF